MSISSPSWDEAPVGLLTVRADGTITVVNQTLLDWVGLQRNDIIGVLRLPQLLSVGGRIYWETHLAPLLQVEGHLDEVALELKGSTARLPVLLTARAALGNDLIQVAISSAHERVRYEQELRTARATAERAARQVSILQQITAGLSNASGVEAVAQALLAAATGPLRGAAAALWLREGEAGLILRGCLHEEPTPHPPDIPGRAANAAPDPDGRIVIALQGQSQLQGVLSVGVPSPDPDPVDVVDVDVLTAIGQQAGLALDRARLHEQSIDVAHELQQSLLASPVPTDARFEVATVYRPGVAALEVGGDWFDVFFAHDRRVVSLVVGDVVGHGLRAASAMGQLRSAVRAIAAPDVAPWQLLSRLDHFVRLAEAAEMATLVYAELDADTGGLRYSCAGHPPPLLLPRNGWPMFLWGGRSTPLGAVVPGERRTEAMVRLHPGDRVVFFTDGLIERRDRPLDEGLEVLTAAAATLAGSSLDVAVRSLSDVLLADGGGRDDVCVLMLRFTGPVGVGDARVERRGEAPGWRVEDMTETPDVSTDPTSTPDPDGDPGQLNPRDERGVPSGDGAAEHDGPDPDGDPGGLNPRN